MTAAVLALQGAFIEHEKALSALNADTFEIRERRDAEKDFDALILPGGESTVMRKLLYDLGLFEPLKERIQSGIPVFGTCAGMILLAKDVVGGETCFSVMDITIRRNAYGRQLGSFFAESDFADGGKIPMTFIRAPYVESAGKNVEVLSEVDGRIVAVREKNMLATAFHPELCDNTAVYEYFIGMINGSV